MAYDMSLLDFGNVIPSASSDNKFTVAYDKETDSWTCTGKKDGRPCQHMQHYTKKKSQYCRHIFMHLYNRNQMKNFYLEARESHLSEAFFDSFEMAI